MKLYNSFLFCPWRANYEERYTRCFEIPVTATNYGVKKYLKDENAFSLEMGTHFSMKKVTTEIRIGDVVLVVFSIFISFRKFYQGEILTIFF